MPPALNGDACFNLGGSVPIAGMATTLKARPGVDGYDVQQIGVRGKPYTLVFEVDCVSDGAMKAAKTALAALQGTLVDITDNFGNVYNNQLLQEVNPVGDGEVRLVNCVGGVHTANGDTRNWLKMSLTFVAV